MSTQNKVWVKKYFALKVILTAFATTDEVLFPLTCTRDLHSRWADLKYFLTAHIIYYESNNRLLKKAVTLEVGQTITTLGYWSRTNLFFPLCGWTWRTQNFKEPSKLNVPLASSQKDALHLSLSLPLSCLLYVSFSRLIASSELAETEQFISPKWTRVGGHGPLNGWLKPPPL